MKIEEIRIPAPWGHIAAKAWGNPQDEVVLLSHGLLDNAGSFDNLIPLLSKDFFYFCIDLPGHGLSSHFDHSLPLYTVDFVLPMKMVCDYLGRTQYIFLGHSYSAQVAIIFSLLYPNIISKLILLDFAAIKSNYPAAFGNRLINSHVMVMDAPNKKEKINSYTYKECIERVIERRLHDHFKRENAEPLVRRMTEKAADGDSYVFTFDKRLGTFINPSMSLEYVIELFKGRAFRCPTLFLAMTDFEMHGAFGPLYKYLKTVKNVEMRFVDGHHDTHNTDPEKICGYINMFLMQQLCNKL